MVIPLLISLFICVFILAICFSLKKSKYGPQWLLNIQILGIALYFFSILTPLTLSII